MGYGRNGDFVPCAATPNTNLSNGEVNQFWAHLSQAGMLSESYPPYSDEDVCFGGIHSLEDFMTGKITPYIKTDPQLNLDYLTGYASDRYSVFAFKPSLSANLNFELYTLPADTLALENKLGVVAFNSTNRQIGLVNFDGINQCRNTLNIVYPCSDPSAQFGMLRYYIAPL
jgi:hypothetical protein